MVRGVTGEHELGRSRGGVRREFEKIARDFTYGMNQRRRLCGEGRLVVSPFTEPPQKVSRVEVFRASTFPPKAKQRDDTVT